MQQALIDAVRAARIVVPNWARWQTISGDARPASSALPVWLKATADGVEITLYVQPGAKKSEVAGEHDGALKLRINAPPVENPRRTLRWSLSWRSAAALPKTASR